MSIISQVARSMQSVLTEIADQVGASCRLVRRVRKFTPATLAQTLVFGFWQNPRATVEELAEMASTCGVRVTPQAIEQRFNAALVTFLQRLLQAMIAQLVEGRAVNVALLRRFNGVYVQDSTVIGLPGLFAKQWAGCGRGDGRPEAGLKVQVQLDLLRGQLHRLLLEPARDPDQKSALQKSPLPRGALRLADLGYFCTATLAALAAQGVYWISRIQSHTAVFDAAGQRLDLPAWLQAHVRRQPAEISVLLGSKQRVPCRLLAVPLPSEVVNRRRQRLYDEARRKGRTPSQARIDWCGWNILVTNVESDRLSICEAWALARARWQIELLFKLWKQRGLVDESVSSKPYRRAAEVFSKLIALVLQHWTLLSSVWQLANRSQVKTVRILRRHVHTLAACLGSLSKLRQALREVSRLLKDAAVVQARRTNPSHHQLLEQPNLLQYALT